MEELHTVYSYADFSSVDTELLEPLNENWQGTLQKLLENETLPAYNRLMISFRFLPEDIGKKFVKWLTQKTAKYVPGKMDVRHKNVMAILMAGKPDPGIVPLFYRNAFNALSELLSIPSYGNLHFHFGCVIFHSSNVCFHPNYSLVNTQVDVVYTHASSVAFFSRYYSHNEDIFDCVADRDELKRLCLVFLQESIRFALESAEFNKEEKQ